MVLEKGGEVYIKDNIEELASGTYFGYNPAMGRMVGKLLRVFSVQEGGTRVHIRSPENDMLYVFKPQWLELVPARKVKELSWK